MTISWMPEKREIDRTLASESSRYWVNGYNSASDIGQKACEENLPSVECIAKMIAKECYGDIDILTRSCEYERNYKTAAQAIHNRIKEGKEKK